MTIERLTKIVRSPATPFEAYSGPWRPIEAELGTSLPPGYKDFVRLYGVGAFMEFLWICVPVSSNRHMRLAYQACAVTSIFRVTEKPPYPLWPDPGGLLPLGTTGAGDELFWLCQGPPADWGVVVWGHEARDFETFDCDLTDFLAGLVTRTRAPKAFPKDLAHCDRLFRPFFYPDWGELSASWQVSYGGPLGENLSSERDASELSFGRFRNWR
jgi:hypothetical protein